jgi:hypothetical protein
MQRNSHFSTSALPILDFIPAKLAHAWWPHRSIDFNSRLLLGGLIGAAWAAAQAPPCTLPGWRLSWRPEPIRPVAQRVARVRWPEAGYAPAAPGWPGDLGTVEESRRDPGQVAGKGIDDVVDHYAQIIRGLEAPPVVIGHSFGGLIAQRLLGPWYQLATCSPKFASAPNATWWRSPSLSSATSTPASSLPSWKSSTARSPRGSAGGARRDGRRDPCGQDPRPDALGSGVGVGPGLVARAGAGG